MIGLPTAITTHRIRVNNVYVRGRKYLDARDVANALATIRDGKPEDEAMDFAVEVFRKWSN